MAQRADDIPDDLQGRHSPMLRLFHNLSRLVIHSLVCRDLTKIVILLHRTKQPAHSQLGQNLSYLNIYAMEFYTDSELRSLLSEKVTARLHELKVSESAFVRNAGMYHGTFSRI